MPSPVAGSPKARWLPRLPMATRLPLAAGAMILVASLAALYIAVAGATRQMEHQLQRMGQIYLDGLSAAVLPAAVQRDVAGVQAALEEALRIHQGLVDRRLMVLTTAGRVLASADRPGLSQGHPPRSLGESAAGQEIDAASGSFWIWRPLRDPRLLPWDGARELKVAAKLDISEYAAERRAWTWSVVLATVLASIAFAVMGLYLVRRIQWPTTLLTRHLREAAVPGSTPIALDRRANEDPEAAQLFQAYNAMVQKVREREALLLGMAQREREALLGRMAATLAHEIRNPLAGTLTAVETLRKFGDEPSTRREALDFMERGLRALVDVADATLRTYRQPDQQPQFGMEDLRDVQRLVAPQARSAGVTVQVEADLPAPVAVAGGEVRQVLLNLLLNAIKASGPGSMVAMRCRLEQGQLQVEVEDQGCGMSPEMARRLERGDAVDLRASGLGVAVVVRLVQRLRGRVAVRARSGRGTLIALAFPLDAGPQEKEIA